MIIPFELFVLGVVFFAGMGVINSVKAYKKNEREYYFSSLISFLVVVLWCLLIVEQIIPMFALMIFVFLVSAWRLPRVLRIVDLELRGTNFSLPLRVREFWSYVGWAKLANMVGARKAVGIFFFFAATCIGGLSYIIHAKYGIMTIPYIMTYSVTFSVMATLLLYQQLKRLRQ